MRKQPNVYIIAGPNGSGKTTFAEEFLPHYAKCPAFINADIIARGLSGFSPDAVALKSGRLLLEQIETFRSKRTDFAFETALSGVTYVSRLKKMKRNGYRVHLFFLWIPDVRLSLARVRSRVKMGGHHVSEEVVRRRFFRGLSNFFKVYRPLLDSWMLFDNSGRLLHLIAEEKAAQLQIFDQKSYGKILKLTEG